MKPNLHHFEVIINNDHYPLSFKTSSVADIYACLDAFDTKYSLDLDRDALIFDLAGFFAGSTLSMERSRYCIYRREGEV